MRTFLMIFGFCIVAVVTIFGFRGAITKKPPLEVFPDMDRQPRYRAQGSNDYFADGRDDRPVPAGTVARGNYLNYAEVFSADFEDSDLGDTAFVQGKNPDGSYVEGFPVPVTNELMAMGREKYEIFCAVCHGHAGDGRGVTTPYGVLAANYHSDKYREMPEGQIYETITQGYGQMLGLQDRLAPQERWAVVLYVRALQLSQNASAADIPEAKRKELGL